MSTSAASALWHPRSTALNHRPGWPEVVIGVAVFGVVGFWGAAELAQSGLNPVVLGLIFAAWSGIAGLAGFAAAALLRIRSWGAFGVRVVSRRWLLIGLWLGVAAFVLKVVAVIAFTALTGQDNNPQGIYAQGASGGMVTVVLSTLVLGILTPIGEEFLFRGVITNALLRHGAVTGVVGSALFFATLHGSNTVFPAAVVAGLFSGEVFRRSGSIWPAVLVHTMFNLPTIPVMVLTE